MNRLSFLAATLASAHDSAGDGHARCIRAGIAGSRPQARVAVACLTIDPTGAVRRGSAQRARGT